MTKEWLCTKCGSCCKNQYQEMHIFPKEVMNNFMFE